MRADIVLLQERPRPVVPQVAQPCLLAGRADGLVEVRGLADGDLRRVEEKVSRREAHLPSGVRETNAQFWGL